MHTQVKPETRAGQRKKKIITSTTSLDRERLVERYVKRMVTKRNQPAIIRSEYMADAIQTIIDPRIELMEFCCFDRQIELIGFLKLQKPAESCLEPIIEYLRATGIELLRKADLLDDNQGLIREAVATCSKATHGLTMGDVLRDDKLLHAAADYVATRLEGGCQ